jgi:hypothetical protein
MTFNVRIFGHKGIVQTRVVDPHQQSTDSLFLLHQPYQWAQTLTTNGTTPVSSAPESPDAATILRIEVPDGQSIRYEINSGTRMVDASAESPLLTGRDQIMWVAGAYLSIIDAAGT